MKDTLTKYQMELKNKLESPVPDKHKHRPNEYREFLVRELKAVTTKIEEKKLEAVKK